MMGSRHLFLVLLAVFASCALASPFKKGFVAVVEQPAKKEVVVSPSPPPVVVASPPPSPPPPVVLSSPPPPPPPSSPPPSPPSPPVQQVVQQQPSPGFVCDKGINPRQAPGSGTNVSPDKCFTCEQQKAFGKCGESFITSGNYCQQTCGAGAGAGAGAGVSPSPSPTPTAAVSVPSSPPPSSPPPQILATPPAPPPPPACQTVAQVATAAKFTTLVKLVQSAGLAGLLSDQKLVATVFAPTDEAFEAFAKHFGATVNDLLLAPAFVKAILQYHVVPGKALPLSALVSAGTLTTAYDGAPLFIKFQGRFNTWSLFKKKTSYSDDTISGTIKVIPTGGFPANIISPADVKACASIIHTVDTVLFPKEVLEQIKRGIIKGIQFLQTPAGQAGLRLLPGILSSGNPGALLGAFGGGGAAAGATGGSNFTAGSALVGGLGIAAAFGAPSPSPPPPSPPAEAPAGPPTA